jgi:geranylgeranylglycerol-phosphate geranylgeranyltransferase
MNSKLLNPYLELLRPLNVCIVFATIFIAGVLAKPEGWDWLLVVVAAAGGALIAGGGNAVNDYFDVRIDKINRPERPLPRGALSLEDAKRIWIATSAAGFVLCLFLGPWDILIAILWLAGLYVYSRYLKGSVLVGNVTVALMTGLAFPFGAIAAGRSGVGVYPGIFAFLANLAREILKDVEDVNGDAAADAETLPVKHGPEAGLLAASIVIGVLVVATLIPFVVGLYNFLYLTLVLLVNLGLGYVVVSMWYDSTLSNLKKLSLILKGCMVGGLGAIFLGS